MRRPGGARLPWYPCGRPTPELAPASAALARRAQRPSSSHILCCAPPAPTTLPGRCRTAAAARQRTPCCSGRELRCPLSRPSNAAERVWSSQGGHTTNMVWLVSAFIPRIRRIRRGAAHCCGVLLFLSGCSPEMAGFPFPCQGAGLSLVCSCCAARAAWLVQRTCACRQSKVCTDKHARSPTLLRPSRVHALDVNGAPT